MRELQKIKPDFDARVRVLGAARRLFNYRSCLSHEAMEFSHRWRDNALAGPLSYIAASIASFTNRDGPP
jgi:hypothetical protein